MMGTVFLSSVLGLLWWSFVVYHVVSLSTSSSELRLRRMWWVTGECSFVIRKLEPTFSDILFFSGTWLVFVDCLSVVSFVGASVVAADQLCMEGSGCHLFAKWFLCHCVFICVSVMFFFCQRQFLKWFLRERFVVLFWHHFRGLKRCVPASVCFLMVECMCFLWGLHRVHVCCDWVHATHELYSDFSFQCCLHGSW